MYLSYGIIPSRSSLPQSAVGGLQEAHVDEEVLVLVAALCVAGAPATGGDRHRGL